MASVKPMPRPGCGPPTQDGHIALGTGTNSFSPSLLTAFRRQNRTLAAVLAAVAAILALSLLWPAARKLFTFGPLHADDPALTLGAGVMALLILEVLKPVLRPRLQSWHRQLRPLALDQTRKSTKR